VNNDKEKSTMTKDFNHSEQLCH